MIKQGLFLCLLTVISMSKSLAQSRTVYFKKIPFYESAYQPFIGAIPIETQTTDGYNLKLTYDVSNRVIQSEVRTGNQLRPLEGFIGLTINAPLTKVEYSEGKEVHYFFDHLENESTVMNDVFTKVYEKDDLGRNVKLSFLQESGEPATDFFGYAVYTWEHLSDGSIVEERFDPEGNAGPLRGSFLLMRTRIFFGPDGFPTTLPRC